MWIPCPDFKHLKKNQHTHTRGLIVLRRWRDVLEKEVEIWFLQQEETDRYKARHVPDLLAWHATIEGLENASSPWTTRNAPPLQSAHPCHRYQTSSTSVILVSTTVLSSLERERERKHNKTLPVFGCKVHQRVGRRILTTNPGRRV
jgi:hypothetical protein